MSECLCSMISIGSQLTESRNWNPDCPEHEGLYHDHPYKGYQRGCKKCRADKKKEPKR